jgi:hypothetical protein
MAHFSAMKKITNMDEYKESFDYWSSMYYRYKNGQLTNSDIDELLYLIQQDIEDMQHDLMYLSVISEANNG